MSAPFDIEELRLNIGGDMEAERMLLATFVESCGESLQLLHSRFPQEPDAAYDQLWKTHMHQIKGAALNIGAADLNRWASSAQRQFSADLRIRQKLLEEVQQALASVTAYIALLLQERKPPVRTRRI